MGKSTDSCGIDFDQLDGLAMSDLRRRRTRALAEHVLGCAALALPEDRALIESVYGDGLTAVQVARLRGERARSVRRRVRRLVERFVSPRFVFVAARRGMWGERRRRVATAVVLEGRTLREAASLLSTSLHVVRKEMSAVEALLELASEGGGGDGGGVGGGGRGVGGVGGGGVGVSRGERVVSDGGSDGGESLPGRARPKRVA